MGGIVGMILFAAFFHGAAIADIGRVLQRLAGSAVVVPTILTAVMLSAELTPTETAVLRFIGTEIPSQAAGEMQTVIALMTASGDKGSALPHLSRYGRRRPADHLSYDLERVPEYEAFLDHRPLGHSQMFCHNASFPPDSPVAILTVNEAFVNLIARVVKLNV